MLSALASCPVSSLPREAKKQGSAARGAAAAASFMATGEGADGTGRRGVPSLLQDGGTGQDEHIASDVTQASLDPFPCTSTLTEVEVGWDLGEAHAERLVWFS